MRSEAARSLGVIGTPTVQATLALIEALFDSSEKVQNAAKEALKVIGAPPAGAVPALLDVLQHKQDLRLLVYNLLSIVESPEAVPDLIRALNDGDEFIRQNIVRALTNIGPPASDAVPELLSLIDYSNDSLRVDIASALWHIEKHEVVVSVLLDVLSSSNFSARYQSARVLGEIGPPAIEALPSLKAATKDKNETVSINSALALWQIARNEVGIPILIGFLDSEDAIIQIEAAKALSKIDTQEAQEALIQAGFQGFAG